MGGVADRVINRGEVSWADVPGDKVRPVLVLTRQRSRRIVQIPAMISELGRGLI